LWLQKKEKNINMHTYIYNEIQQTNKRESKEKAKKQKAVGKSSYNITQNITQNTHLH